MTSTISRLRVLLLGTTVTFIVGVGFYWNTSRYQHSGHQSTSLHVKLSDKLTVISNKSVSVVAEGAEGNKATDIRDEHRPLKYPVVEVSVLSTVSGTYTPRTSALSTLVQPTQSDGGERTVDSNTILLPPIRRTLIDERNSTNVRRLLDTLAVMKRERRIGSLRNEGKVLIYNKVGKCGSRSLIRLLSIIAEKNRLALVGSIIGSIPHLQKPALLAVTKLIQQLPSGSIYHRHVHFLKVKRSSPTSPQLVYFNMIRHPLDRTVSSYYFHRFGDNAKAGIRGVYDRSTDNETFDECVDHRRKSCSSPKALWYIVPYFCGQEKACRFPSRWALIRAKQCVVKDYLFVGLSEYFNETVQAMEKLLPEVFAGASEAWRNNTLLARYAEKTKTRQKKRVLVSTRRFVLSQMKLELEFYTFVRKRFFSTLKRLGIGFTQAQPIMHE